MSRVKAARRDHYGILRGFRYAGRVKFGHPRGQIERRHIRSVCGHSRTHGYFARGFPLDGHGNGSNGEVLTHAALDIGIARRNGGGVSVRVRARIVLRSEPLDRHNNAAHGHGSQRYALLFRIVSQVFFPSHGNFLAANVKLVHGDGQGACAQLVIRVGIFARQLHGCGVSASRGIGNIADNNGGLFGIVIPRAQRIAVAFEKSRYPITGRQVIGQLACRLIHKGNGCGSGHGEFGFADRPRFRRLFGEVATARKCERIIIARVRLLIAFGCQKRGYIFAVFCGEHGV